MTASDPAGQSRAIWRKSSYSSPTSNDCVEVTTSRPGTVAVRDSKNPHGPALIISKPEWVSFVTRLRATA